MSDRLGWGRSAGIAALGINCDDKPTALSSFNVRLEQRTK